MSLKIIGFIACLGVALSYNAQVATDTELWTGGGLNLKLNKKFKVYAEEQFRFNDTISSLKSSLTDVGIKYQINQHFSLSGDFRHTIREAKNNRNRYSLSATYKLGNKKNPLSLKYRLRFQDTKESVSEKKFTYMRNKFTLDYNLSKLVDPFFSYETYFRFNQKNEFRSWKIVAGLDWRLAKSIDLTTFYRYQKEINVKRPEAEHIIGLMLTYKIRAKKEAAK